MKTTIKNDPIITFELNKKEYQLLRYMMLIGYDKIQSEKTWPKREVYTPDGHVEFHIHEADEIWEETYVNLYDL